MRAVFVDPFVPPFMARALVQMLLLAVLSGVVSAFVLARRLSFVADTLTHTVFPGVVAGYLAAGVAGVFPGALVAAVLTALLLTLFTRVRRVSEDTALAVLLTGMFAIGVVLVSRRSSYTADLTAFLFGRLLAVSREQVIQTAFVAAVVLAVLAAVYKELRLRAFDADAAAAMGYRIALLDLVLNTTIALVVVAAAQSVGTILVLALLIVPAATGRLVSDRMAGIMAAGVLTAGLAGYLGLAASYHASIRYGLRLASGAMVVLSLIALYLLALAGAGVWRWAAAAARPWSRHRHDALPPPGGSPQPPPRGAPPPRRSPRKAVPPPESVPQARSPRAASPWSAAADPRARR